MKIHERIKVLLEELHNQTAMMSVHRFEQYRAFWVLVNEGQHAYAVLFDCIDEHPWIVMAVLDEIFKEDLPNFREEDQGKMYHLVAAWKEWYSKKRNKMFRPYSGNLK